MKRVAIIALQLAAFVLATSAATAGLVVAGLHEQPENSVQQPGASKACTTCADNPTGVSTGR